MKFDIFFMFASFVFVMGLFVVFLLLETKGIPIDKMKENVWKKHWFWRGCFDEKEDANIFFCLPLSAIFTFFFLLLPCSGGDAALNLTWYQSPALEYELRSMAWPPPNANSTRAQAPPPVVPAMATGSVPAAAAPTAANANRNTQVPIIDFNSSDAGNPYYLHSNESPALVLVSPALDGSNYHPWARAMKIALSTKNKLAFIDGSITVPSNDEPRYMVWERCNNMVVAWIVRSISPEIAQSVLWLQSAIAIWKHLEERFSEGDIFRISQIQGQAYQLKQGILSVDKYFTQMKLLWDELLVLRPLPVCACTPKCSCGGYEKFYTYVENDHLSISIGAANQVQFTTAEQPYNENVGGVTLSQDEYRLFKQVLQRDNMTYNSPLEVSRGVAPQANLIAGVAPQVNLIAGVAPQANLIAANVARNSQLEAGNMNGQGPSQNIILPNDSSIMEDDAPQRPSQTEETRSSDGHTESDSHRSNLSQGDSDLRQPILPQSDPNPVQPRRSSRQKALLLQIFAEVVPLQISGQKSPSRTQISRRFRCFFPPPLPIADLHLRSSAHLDLCLQSLIAITDAVTVVCVCTTISRRRQRIDEFTIVSVRAQPQPPPPWVVYTAGRIRISDATTYLIFFLF
nr:uncharacterized protein LOC109157807 [Ipomoea batatas]